jgi:hypothetical protein
MRCAQSTRVAEREQQCGDDRRQREQRRVPRRPVTSRTGVTTSGPSAIPTLPPTENQLMAWVEFPATSRPAAISQPRRCRSVSTPNAGWIAPDRNVAASVMPVSSA